MDFQWWPSFINSWFKIETMSKTQIILTFHFMFYYPWILTYKIYKYLTLHMWSDEVNSPYTMNCFNIFLWLCVRYNVIECVFIEARLQSPGINFAWTDLSSFSIVCWQCCFLFLLLLMFLSKIQTSKECNRSYCKFVCNSNYV